MSPEGAAGFEAAISSGVQARERHLVAVSGIIRRTMRAEFTTHEDVQRGGEGRGG